MPSTSDFDRKANFTQYKTYSWQEIKPANSLWDARIKNAVDAQLAAKGVDSGGQRRRRVRRSDQDDPDPENSADFL